MFHPMSRAALAAALGCAAPFAAAQQSLNEVTVTATPAGPEAPLPATRLAGPELMLRGNGSLGETLDGTPGVSSSSFAPAANRPIVRGQDGDRVRILNNGGTVLDLSGLSGDHAVPLDPIAVDRIEVLRGPAALLRGGNALGGTIDVIDNRIPREPAPGVTGKADLGYATGRRERSSAVLVEGGTAQVGLHVDAFRRAAGDVRVPADLACTRAGVTEVARRICNSAADANGGALGASVFLPRGYVGLSLSEYSAGYGTVAEDETTVALRSRRQVLEAELRDLPGLRSVRLQAVHSRYRHTEFEAGTPGTVFAAGGNSVRLEARHAPVAGVAGVIGLQAERSSFSADGDEAFAPYSRTRQLAVFAHEEASIGRLALSAAARLEQVAVTSLGNPAVGRFVTGERRFHPASVAFGASWPLAQDWRVSGNLARSQRAPRDYELFADGPHVATGAWELGDPRLGTESATHAEAGLAWAAGAHKAEAHLFHTRYARYIGLVPTGATQTTAGGDVVPEYAYQAVAARFRGLEANGTWRLRAAGPRLDLLWRADMVRADNLDTGAPLPRIAPWRLGATLVAADGPWSVRVGLDRHASQRRVPAGDLPTPGYTVWSAALTWRVVAGRADLLWYARLDNATDRLGYSVTSVLTQTAPGRSPLPGRSLKLGLQAAF